MYSDNIDKICDVCVYSKSAKGSATHLQCSYGGYVPRSYTCSRFKYDVIKKHVRRKPKLEHKFSAADFEL